MDSTTLNNQFEVIPEEILTVIASYLDIQSIINFSLTCEIFRPVPQTKPKYIRLNSIETMRYCTKYIGIPVDTYVEYGGIYSDLEDKFVLKKEVCNSGVIDGQIYNVWSYNGLATVITICHQRACRLNSIYVYSVPTPIYVLDLIDAVFYKTTYLYGLYNDTRKQSDLIRKLEVSGGGYLVEIFTSNVCRETLKGLSPKL